MKSSMSLFGNVIVSWTRSSHAVAPSGTRKRTTNGIAGGDAALDLVGARAIAAAVVLERLARAPRPPRGAPSSSAGVQKQRYAVPLSSRRCASALMALEVRALVDDVLVPVEAEPLEPSKIARVLSSVLRALSVSSMRSRNWPPYCLA